MKILQFLTKNPDAGRKGGVQSKKP
jgi:hypothetical protein